MARTSTASSRTTKKASSASSAGRKASGASRSASSAAKKSSGTSAKKSSSAAAKKSSGASSKSSGAAKKSSSASTNSNNAANKARGSAKRTTESAGRAVKSAAGAATGTAKRAAGAATGTAKRAAGAATRGASSTARKATGTSTRATGATKGRGASTSRSQQRPDALQVLIDDHRRVEQLFRRFKKSGNDDRARGEIAETVLEELSVHAIIEEQAFYPAVRQIEKLEKMVLEALEEHHFVKVALAELEKMNPGDERFEAKFTVMMENVQHHVEEEEQDMFPKVRRAMSREQLEAIGAALVESKGTAPTRPHPRSPDTPPGNMIAAAVTAPLDAAINAGKGAVEAVRNFASGNN